MNRIGHPVHTLWIILKQLKQFTHARRRDTLQVIEDGFVLLRITNSVTISAIRFGPPGMEVTETWRFSVRPDDIAWRIDRTYRNSGMLEDSCFPAWDFENRSTWTGALVGDGGVAWAKLFDAPNASYGVHNGKVTFWNDDQPNCLRIVPKSLTGSKIAAGSRLISQIAYSTPSTVVPAPSCVRRPATTADQAAEPRLNANTAASTASRPIFDPKRAVRWRRPGLGGMCAGR